MSKQRFGEMLRALRKAKGLTQVELAEQVGLTQSYLAELESGTKKNPSLAVLQRLAKALGVPVTKLLE